MHIKKLSTGSKATLFTAGLKLSKVMILLRAFTSHTSTTLPAQARRLPSLLNEIFEKRKHFKSEYKKNPNPITKARSNAFKVLSASVHGYIGFFGARYYSLESSASILAFVRKFSKETIEKIKKQGYQVIYSDTDSIAFLTNGKSEEV